MGIKEVYTSILAKIVASLAEVKHSRVWNNQLDQVKEGEMYVFPFPAIFVEIQTPSEYLPLLSGYAAADLQIKIHVCHEQYDAGDGTFEQNLDVFDLRAEVIKQLTGFQPTGCGLLMKGPEEQDFEHDNIYHLIITFLCNHIDDSGSLDNQHPTVEMDPGPDLVIQPEVKDNIDNQNNENYREIWPVL